MKSPDPPVYRGPDVAAAAVAGIRAFWSSAPAVDRVALAADLSRLAGDPRAEEFSRALDALILKDLGKDYDHRLVLAYGEK